MDKAIAIARIAAGFGMLCVAVVGIMRTNAACRTRETGA